MAAFLGTLSSDISLVLSTASLNSITHNSRSGSRMVSPSCWPLPRRSSYRGGRGGGGRLAGAGRRSSCAGAS